MGSVGLGEIVIIAAIVLIIFGPDRLPEIARKGAELIRKSRAATSELTSTLRDEYGDVIAPLNEVREELKSVRRDLTSAATSIAEDASAVGKELKATIDPTLAPMAQPPADSTGKEPDKVEPGDGEPGDGKPRDVEPGDDRPGSMEPGSDGSGDGETA
jgi:sec-independent protein translocase protein TatB